MLPSLAIGAGEVQRWRIVNASASRVFRIGLEGQKMIHVGNDGGLFEKPVECRTTSRTVSCGGIVRVSMKPVREQAQALPSIVRPAERPANCSHARTPHTRANNKGRTGHDSRETQPSRESTRRSETSCLTLSRGSYGLALEDRVDFRAKLDDTEIWEIENVVGMDHPFHLHGFQFQVIDRNGVPEPFRSWKDMVNVPKHETARIIVSFANYPGKWMFHCHILDHEDHGMMGILEVQ